MELISDNSYRKKMADLIHRKFSEYLRDGGKISEQVFQDIIVTSEPKSPTLFEHASNELYKMRAKLEHVITTCYMPESTRWHRNYTDRADWYYLCEIEGG